MTRRAWTLLLIVALAAAPGPVQAQPVEGFVELHSHLAGRLAFGGSWFWGHDDGWEPHSLRRCDGNFFSSKSHGATRWPIVSEFVGSGYGSQGDTGWHRKKRNGYDTRKCAYFWGIKIPGTCPDPHYSGWPRWDTMAHQQMWSGWLREAHQGGLRILVASMAESNLLCNTTPPSKRLYGCGEMESVHRQAAYLRDYAIYNSSWMGIATTPAQARSLIHQGKLAVLLSVEVTQLFPGGDYISQLDALRDMGVVSIQVAHHADNRFGGAAPIKETMKGAVLTEALLGDDISDIDEIVCRTASGQVAPCDGVTSLNVRGLTQDGQALVWAMMNRGMLIDVAHVSRRTFLDMYDLARNHGDYPIFSSHAHMWETIRHDPDHPRHEKYIRPEEIQLITNTGGMIGLRPGPEPANDYSGGSPVANTCDGSSRSFAQSLMYAVDKGLSVGFGADLNGMIKQLRPRYDCAGERPEILAAGGPSRLQRHGLGHIGMLPELMSDLRAVGVADHYVDHLNRSAETFLQMWERSEGLRHTTLPGDNLARTASAFASSTYCWGTGIHCYSPARVNDGDRDTRLGGYYSWANAGGVPAWVELAWPVDVTVNHVNLYTSAGYEMRGYRIEYWDENRQDWVTPPGLAVPDNVFAYRFHRVSPPVTTRRLRVLGLSGPSHQTNHVRVNELEVY